MEENVFEIEKILETSVTEGIRYYFVSWKGYSEPDNTWEPEENLHDCEDVLQTFWKGAKKQKTKKGRKRVSPFSTNGSKKKKRVRKSKAENSVKNDQECVLAENNNENTEVPVETNDSLHSEELFTMDKVPLPVSLVQNVSTQEYTDEEKEYTDDTRSYENQYDDNVVEVSRNFCHHNEVPCDESNASCDTDYSTLELTLSEGPFDKSKDESESFEMVSQKPVWEVAKGSTDSGKSDVEIDTMQGSTCIEVSHKQSIRKSSGPHAETDISELQGEHYQEFMTEDIFDLELNASETENDKKYQEEANSLVVDNTDSPEIDKTNAFIAGDKDVALTSCSEGIMLDNVESCLFDAVENQQLVCKQKDILFNQETKLRPTVETYLAPTSETELTSTMETEFTPTVEAGLTCTPTTETELTPTLETELTPTMETELTPTVEAGLTPTTETDLTPTLEMELTSTFETELSPTMETEFTPTVEAELTPTVEAELTPTSETELTATLETELTLTMETEFTPTVEAELTPTTETELTPTSETELTLTMETEVTPTLETELIPTSETEVTPTSKTEVTPTSETEVTPMSETEVTPTSETEVTPTVETEVTPTSKTEVTPTSETEVTPMSKTELTPTSETELTPTSETELTPISETEVTPTSETEVTPTSETELTPTSETELTPTSETELTPTSETELTPTSETKLTPTSETELTPISQTELTSTMEIALTPTLATKLTPSTIETELIPTLERKFTPISIETVRLPSTLETEITPATETGIPHTMETDLSSTIIETEVTPIIMETEVTPIIMETEVTPIIMETEVTPIIMETEVTPTDDTVTPTEDTEVLPPTRTIGTAISPHTRQVLTSHLNEVCGMGDEKNISADKVIKQRKPGTCISRIFDNLQKIKKKIILKPLFAEQKLKTKVTSIETHSESSNNCSSPNNKSDSCETLEKSSVESRTLQSVNSWSSLSPANAFTDCLVPEAFEESLLPVTAKSNLSMEKMMQTSFSASSPPNMEEINYFPLIKMDNSPELDITEENVTKDWDENYLQSPSPAVVDVTLDSLEINKLSQLHIVSENLSPEDTEEHCLGDIAKGSSEWNFPEQKSLLEFQNSCETDHAQTGKQPLIISISDSDSTDGEIKKKKRSKISSTHSKHLSTKGSHSKVKKDSRSSTASGRKKNSSKKPQNEKCNSPVSTCDVVSEIINSSSLKKTSKVDQKQKTQGSTGKNGGLERHESDMDVCESDFEFDLDDYNPVELINEKPSKLKKDLSTQGGIPLAISLRDVKKAIRRGDSSTILAALAGGLDIESPDVVTGMSLLMRAVSISYDSIVKLLINHGANVDAKDNSGSTPLMLTCEQGFESTASLLMEAEADVNAKTINGETALIKACKKGFIDVTILLLAHGADCHMRSQSGWTASQWAQHCGHFEICDVLVAHNKKLQSCVEKAIITCLGHSRCLVSPPLLPYVCLYPNEDQKFIYHFNCSNQLLGKTVLLFCFRAVFSRSGEVDLSFSKDNGVRTIILNGVLQRPVLKNNRSVFKVHPKQDTNRLVLQTYQSHVHLLVCIYAADLDGDFLKIEHSSVMV